MDWAQVIAIVGSTIGCCYYFRKETKEQLNSVREEMKETREEWKSWRASHDEEMKDFHGRMCKLEERYLQFLESRKK